MPRRLRIAVTALGLTAALLFAVWWVRSYWQADTCAMVVSKSTFVGIGSTHGSLTATRGDNGPGYFNGRWDIHSDPIVHASDYQLNTGSSEYRGRFGFGVFRNPSFTTLNAPHWAFVLAAGVVAALPWIKPPLQFSLRTLLIAMTLIAVLIGALVISL
jgi:hypothetical protein